MSNTYVIQWKSKVNGRAGRGTKQFSLEEAHLLANELNRQYPNIHHEVLESKTTGTDPEHRSQPEPQTPEGSPVNEGAPNALETHAFSE